MDEAIKYLNKDGEAHATVIVLAPLSDEVYIRQGDLHNTMQRGIAGIIIITQGNYFNFIYYCSGAPS